jgi:hypothetical protein
VKADKKTTVSRSKARALKRARQADVDRVLRALESERRERLGLPDSYEVQR